MLHEPAAVARPRIHRTRRIHVWDLPLRVFHWALVLAVTLAVITGKLGGDWMAWHGRAGLAILGLLVFRLVWGVLGSPTARFAQFAPTPRSVAACLRGQWRGTGHNPLGALSVFALLGVLGAQVATGLFGNDDISFSGPLYALVDDSLAGRLTGWHRQIAWGLSGLLALHVAAIVFYLVHRKTDLVTPMLTGWKDAEAGTTGSAPSGRRGGTLAFAVAVATALGSVYGVAVWLPGGADTPPGRPANPPATPW